MTRRTINTIDRDPGIARIDDEPGDGVWGRWMAVLHPRDTDGVLVEFVEH